jgi:hypothetical protein
MLGAGYILTALTFICPVLINIKPEIKLIVTKSKTYGGSTNENSFRVDGNNEVIEKQKKRKPRTASFHCFAVRK